MYCKHCGAFMTDDAKFCTNCGGKLEARPTRIVYQEELPKDRPQVDVRRIWLVASGALSIVLAAVALIRSGGLFAPLDALAMAGRLVVLPLLAAGLVSMMAAGQTGRGPITAAIVLFVLAGALCLMYTALIPWGLWCVACIVVDCVLRSRK